MTANAIALGDILNSVEAEEQLTRFECFVSKYQPSNWELVQVMKYSQGEKVFERAFGMLGPIYSEEEMTSLGSICKGKHHHEARLRELRYFGRQNPGATSRVPAVAAVA